MTSHNPFCSECGTAVNLAIHNYCDHCGHEIAIREHLLDSDHRNPSPNLVFLGNAKLGINKWWVWIISVFSILIIWNLLGFIPNWLTCKSLTILAIETLRCEDYTIIGISYTPNFIVANTSFIIGLVGIYYVIKVLHKKQFIHLFTARANIDYKRVFLSASIWGAILTLLLILDLSLFDSGIKFQSPEITEYLLFAIFVLMLTPIQASMEEVFFRGYLLQGIHLVFKNRLATILMSSALFTSIHLANPEPYEYGFIPYITAIFIMGTFLSLITILDGGIEIATGLHMMNNMWIFLVANTEVSVLNSPSLFIIPIQKYALLPDIPVQIIMNIIVIALLNKKYKWFSWSKLYSAT